MKKKICIFCSLPSFNTGMPISTYKLSVGLVNSGRYDVIVVLPKKGEFSDRLKSASVNFKIIPFCRFRTKPLLMLKFMASYFYAGFQFFKFIRNNGIDIVHFSDIIDAPFYPWARLAGVVAVGHIRVCVGKGVVKHIFRIWTSIFCSRIVTVSEFAKTYFGFGGTRARVVYNPGPDRALFNPSNIIKSEKFTDACAIPTVIAVASFRSDKGHHNFLEIASRVKKKFSDDVKFVIIGGKVSGHERYYKRIMDDIRLKGLDGCLTVTGNLPHEEIPKIMLNAAALLHVPDWEEALGGVILEAMAMGVPVAAYNSGGVGECFTDGVSGIFVKRGDFDSAADKIVAILKSRDLRQKMALAAREELNAKFTMDNYICGIEKIYDEIFYKGARVR